MYVMLMLKSGTPSYFPGIMMIILSGWEPKITFRV